MTIYQSSISGSILNSRIVTTASTGSIANGANVALNITATKGYMLYKIETSAAAWVRVYASSADRTADTSRTIYTDPTVNAGVIAEVITTGNQIIRISPGVLGYNDESPTTNIIPISVVNKSGSANNITVKLTILPLEN
jgi:hypothetical protein